ncbi:hypothetical protein FLK61_39510 [Paenalkalicoccus suaedae]|uniref:Uncharacterized protein n=1 Tax=Paenalkalicoccus suaedae TaxID=2592382 RepID=A0A859FIS6_9BACI|nr:hypothetical protein FLK61_39510 [Paenalkalicoccus suaedae]
MTSLIGIILLFSSVYYGIMLADYVILSPYSSIDMSIYEIAVGKYTNAFFSVGLVTLIAGLVALFLLFFKRITNADKQTTNHENA